MPQFTYNLPSGSVYKLNAPDGTTQAQADQIFYSQVAAGSFVGYAPGDTLSSIETQLTSFGISRLERGTAGVTDLTILSIISGLPVVSPVPVLVDVPLTQPVNQSDVALVASSIPAPPSIGTLTSPQVQTLLAQLSVLVGQPADQLTQEKGIGKYGFNCSQLERIGYIKPGSCARFLGAGTTQDNISALPFQNPDNFVALMNSPSIWTGKNGILGVDSVLANEDLQNQMQIELLERSYQILLNTGLVTDPTTPPLQISQGQIYVQSSPGAAGTLQKLSALTQLTGRLALTGGTGLSGIVNSALQGVKNLSNLSPGAVIQNLQNLASGAVGNLTQAFNNVSGLAGSIATKVSADVGALMANVSKFGSQATELWSKGLSLDVKGAMDNLGKSAQFAVNFAKNQLSSLIASVQPAAGFSSTVNRSVIDTAFTKILGNAKIPTPDFTPPSISSIGANLDIAQAQNFLASAKDTAGQAVNQVTAQANRVATQTGQVVNQATRAVNRLT